MGGGREERHDRSWCWDSERGETEKRKTHHEECGPEGQREPQGNTGGTRPARRRQRPIKFLISEGKRQCRELPPPFPAPVGQSRDDSSLLSSSSSAAARLCRENISRPHFTPLPFAHKKPFSPISRHNLSPISTLFDRVGLCEIDLTSSFSFFFSSTHMPQM